MNTLDWEIKLDTEKVLMIQEFCEKKEETYIRTTARVYSRRR